jgi:glycosyltransferase involved in cell wall biosynthesis
LYSDFPTLGRSVLKLSVVIPTLNRGDLLSVTVDRIARQTLSRDQYEVIVVDNGSTDHTRTILEQKRKTYPHLKHFSQLKRGAAATRNVGIRNSSGEIVLFIDDDIFAEPNLAERHLAHHAQNDRVSIIGGVTTPWARCNDPFLRYLRDRRIFNPYSITGGPIDFSYYHTGNVSTERGLLLEAGGFNEDFFTYGMEDIELGYRLEKLGCRMIHAPEARAVHQYSPTYDQFTLRCEQAGYSLGKLIELHPELKPRFVESGKRTRLLKRFHMLYRMFSFTSQPVTRVVTKWEERRGTGPVAPLLDQHYYWALRYHFFLGYRQYNRPGRTGRRPASDSKYEHQPDAVAASNISR